MSAEGQGTRRARACCAVANRWIRSIWRFSSWITVGLALLPALALAATTTYTYDELGRLKVVRKRSANDVLLI